MPLPAPNPIPGRPRAESDRAALHRAEPRRPRRGELLRGSAARPASRRVPGGPGLSGRTRPHEPRRAARPPGPTLPPGGGAGLGGSLPCAALAGGGARAGRRARPRRPREAPSVLEAGPDGQRPRASPVRRLSRHGPQPGRRLRRRPGRPGRDRGRRERPLRGGVPYDERHDRRPPADLLRGVGPGGPERPPRARLPPARAPRRRRRALGVRVRHGERRALHP